MQEISVVVVVVSLVKQVSRDTSAGMTKYLLVGGRRWKEGCDEQELSTSLPLTCSIMKDPCSPLPQPLGVCAPRDNSASLEKFTVILPCIWYTSLRVSTYPEGPFSDWR